MNPLRMSSKRDGTCTSCDERFSKGAPILYAKAHGGVVGCPSCIESLKVAQAQAASSEGKEGAWTWFVRVLSVKPKRPDGSWVVLKGLVLECTDPKARAAAKRAAEEARILARAQTLDDEDDGDGSGGGYDDGSVDESEDGVDSTNSSTSPSSTSSTSTPSSSTSSTSASTSALVTAGPMAMMEMSDVSSLPPGYFVAKTLTFVGPLGLGTRVNDEVELQGTFSRHPQFGPQVKALGPPVFQSFDTLEGVRAFLVHMPQIKKIRADQIIQAFNGDVEKIIDVLLNSTEDLAQIISGITPERAEAIREEFIKQDALRRSYESLSGINAAPRVVGAALRAWGRSAHTILDANAMALMLLPHVKWETAEEIGRAKGIERSDKRYQIAVATQLAMEIERDGHTAIPLARLFPNSSDGADSRMRCSRFVKKHCLTNADLDQLIHIGTTMSFGSTLPADALKHIDEEMLERLAHPPFTLNEGILSPMWLRTNEVEIAGHVARLSAAKLPTVRLPVDLSVMMDGKIPSDEQEAAIRMFSTSAVMILRGAAGVGKSQTTRALIQAAEYSHLNFALAAPTGKAAQVMRRMTKRSASTIHRLIAPALNGAAFQIAARVLILDEVSMLSVDIAATLLRCVSSGTRVVFVGDPNQLPSIGPGRVLQDLIDSGCIPIQALTKIFRTRDSSPIPYVARDVLEQTVPMTVNQIDSEGHGVAWINAGASYRDAGGATSDDANDDAASVAAYARNTIVKLVSKTLVEKKRGSIKSAHEIMVLSPQWEGECGVNALNVALQEAMNPPMEARPSVSIARLNLARTGDPLRVTANDYVLGVSNGEVGRVIALSDKNALTSTDDWKAGGYTLVTPDPKANRPTNSKVGSKSGSKTRKTNVNHDVNSNANASRDMNPNASANANANALMSTKSNPEVCVTASTDKALCLLVEFASGESRRLVAFSRGEAYTLELAYALTGHSAQGSSAKLVVLPVLKSHTFMLTLTWLYTMLTRAENFLCIIYEDEALKRAVRNTRDQSRCTYLAESIRATFADARVDDRPSLDTGIVIDVNATSLDVDTNATNLDVNVNAKTGANVDASAKM